MTHTRIWEACFNTPLHLSRSAVVALWHDSFICVWHENDSHIYVAWLIHTRIWEARFYIQFRIENFCRYPVTLLVHICVTRRQFIYTCDLCTVVRFICVIWLIREFDMTHPDVWHDLSICVTLVHVWHTCKLQHENFARLVFVCVTWSIWIGNINHSYVWHDLYIRVTYLIHMCHTF